MGEEVLSSILTHSAKFSSHFRAKIRNKSGEIVQIKGRVGVDVHSRTASSVMYKMLWQGAGKVQT